MKLKDKTAITLQVDNDMLEDVRVLMGRRGQSLSEFIRRAMERELYEDARRSVTD